MCSAQITQHNSLDDVKECLAHFTALALVSRADDEEEEEESAHVQAAAIAL